LELLFFLGDISFLASSSDEAEQMPELSSLERFQAKVGVTENQEW
jgi:hypothetical protein